MKQSLYIGLIVMMLTGSCYWDNEETLYGSSTCNTTSVTYSLDVAPLFNSNCNSCHSTQSAASLGGNVVLDNYKSVLIYANNGHLMGSLNQKQGYFAMPLGGAKLTACQLQTIQTWIDNGALYN